MRKVFITVAVAALLLTTSGCARLTLKHTPLPAAASSLGAVSLVVRDVRPEDRGAGSEKLVGNLRNLYGMRLKFEAKNSMVGAVQALFADALTSAGYQVTEGAPVAVVVDIAQYWMDGYMGYKMETKFMVYASKGETPVFSKEITEVNAFGHTSNKRLYAGFDQLMDKIAEQARAMFASPEFQTAVQ